MVAEQIDATGPPAARIRELARGHLPLIMPERSITVGELLGRNEDIGVLVNGQDPVAIRRRSARERNRRRHKGETVDTVPDALPDGPVLKRKSKNPGSRSTVREDPMLKRAVPLVPLMAHLVHLCQERDRPRGDFIAAYCWLLDRSPRGVSKDALAELAAREPFVMHVATAYRWLDWGYRIFSDWSAQEFLIGHVFTAEQLEPMRAWVQTQAEGWPLEDRDEPPGEQC